MFATFVSAIFVVSPLNMKLGRSNSHARNEGIHYVPNARQRATSVAQTKVYVLAFAQPTASPPPTVT